MTTAHITAMFAALGDPTRLAVWRLLCACRAAGAGLDEIASCIQVVPSELVNHLRCMCEAGLLTDIRQTAGMVYAIDPACVVMLATEVASWALEPGHNVIALANRDTTPDAGLLEGDDTDPVPS